MYQPHNTSLLFVIFIILMICYKTISMEIKAVALLTNNGDRSPYFPYPFDPHKFYKWPGGYGALTPEGVRELFRSGLLKAERYSRLLKMNSTSNVYARSSAIERCIISAESFLDGFLPGIYRNVSVNIPVGFDDTMLTWPGKICKRYEPNFLRLMSLKQSDVLKMTNNGDVIWYLKNNTGQVITDLMVVLTIIDTLTVERDRGLQWPGWVDGIYDNYLVPLAKLIMLKATSSMRSYTKIGVLLYDMINRMDAFVYDQSPQNFWFYSAHDTTVQGLLVVLGVLNQVGSNKPNNGASVAIELHNRDGGIEVKVFYFRDAIDTMPIHIMIPDCPLPCLYGPFKKSISSKLVSNFDDVCNFLR